MAWFRLALVPLLASLLVVGLSSRAAPPDAARMEHLLALNTAIKDARDHLQRGHYLAAVQSLEAKIESVDGHREYLRTLRDAYLGLVRELNQTGKEHEAEPYLRRLKAIDPGASLELASRPPATPTPTPSQAPDFAPAARTPMPPPAPSPFAPRQPGAGPVPASLAAGSAPPVPGQFTPTPTTVRGVPGVDPFAEENSTQLQEARGFLVRAEREFADKNYAGALGFFDLAHALAPKLLGEARDRWAYCKMHSVVTALNQQGGRPNPQELERVVRHAMSLAPEKLNGYGQQLLGQIQALQTGRPLGTVTLPEGPVEIRHTGRQGNWAVAESANFRFYHNLPTEAVEKAVRLAETTRVQMTRKWFNENPAPWVPRCDVYLHATGQDYARATQQSPSVPGHSTIQNEGERILSRRVDLHVDDANALVGVLPHETTHVILAGRFGPKPLPRWADEGLAVLSEPADRIQRHLTNLPQHYREGLLFRLSHLVAMDNYPDARSVGAFYAQGVSLCDYLVSKKGPTVFTQFLRDGLHSGWEPAIQKHYGLQGFVELEQQWLAAALATQTTRSQSPPK